MANQRIQYKKKLSIEVLKTHGSNLKIKKLINLNSFTDIIKVFLI